MAARMPIGPKQPNAWLAAMEKTHEIVDALFAEGIRVPSSELVAARVIEELAARFAGVSAYRAHIEEEAWHYAAHLRVKGV